jgi:UDP-N-acetylglucosamine 1-carboxyvinyltransferase
MAKFVIVGGKKPKGEIKVSGSKNAALALIPATLLIDGVTIFRNLPRIQDVFSMLEILKLLGGEYKFLSENEILIDTRNISYQSLKNPLVSKLRGSILFLGPLLARFGKAEISFPGGDIIGARPIKVHLQSLSQLGAKINVDKFIFAKMRKIKNNKIFLSEISVTASELMLMASAYSPNYVELRMMALEPHVQTLAKFLSLLGFDVKGIGTHFVKIKKGKNLKKRIVFDIPPDPIEAGTFVALGAATKGEIKIYPVNPEEMDALLIIAKEMNINLRVKDKTLIVKPSHLKGTKIQTGLYPKFPTDLQPPFGVMATQGEGVTLIHDWLYENRFGYLNELHQMGANVEILDPHRAIIIGPTLLHGTEVNSLDIRSGISLIIAGLVAQGKTIIHDVEKIDRGYEEIEKKLQKIGLEIERIQE